MSESSGGNKRSDPAGFWSGIENTVREVLALFEINDDDTDAIICDLMARWRSVPVELPLNVHPDFFGCLSATIVDAVKAEQRLFKARYGRFPGLVPTDWPVWPIEFEHPFLARLQAATGGIEAEANSAEGGGRVN